ncbi:hypothetical protein F504_4120 (plasmid) [Ralstonia pseudosolanacearum FQY_4]|nr:hypothetical protein F504_4120 [Ralstonia pseudosolanacearum FQY_4]
MYWIEWTSVSDQSGNLPGRPRRHWTQQRFWGRILATHAPHDYVEILNCDFNRSHVLSERHEDRATRIPAKPAARPAPPPSASGNAVAAPASPAPGNALPAPRRARLSRCPGTK